MTINERLWLGWFIIVSGFVSYSIYKFLFVMMIVVKITNNWADTISFVIGIASWIMLYEYLKSLKNSRKTNEDIKN